MARSGDLLYLFCKHRNVYTQNARYKLYKDGRFFDMRQDILETEPLNHKNLTAEQIEIKGILASELATFPDLPATSYVRGQKK